MDLEILKNRLKGCYMTVPTMFRDPELELDLEATRSHVRFLMERGINADNAVLLTAVRPWFFHDDLRGARGSDKSHHRGSGRPGASGHGGP